MSSNKAQNTDSCRGLDGRRLSTIKEAQKYVLRLFALCSIGIARSVSTV